MESQGTTRGDTDRDNVVHLPARDWLGPREELVPVGPSRQSDSPPRADDFWSEDSAALQDALQPPAAPKSAAVEPPTSDDDFRRLPQVAAGARRRWLAAGAFLAVAGVVALIAVGLGGGHAPVRAAGTKTQLAAANESTRAGRRSVHRASHRQRAVTHKSVPRPAVHRHVVAATTTTKTPAVSTSNAGTSLGSTDVVSTASNDTAASNTSSSTGHPTGPGAPFAPGYIP
jgi:hypothetical protein